MFFRWLESLVVALLSAATYSTALCSPGQTTQIWTNDIHPHILEPSNNKNCGGAHLASSLLAALNQVPAKVRNVNIMFSSLDAGLLEVSYQYMTPTGTAWKNKTLWNDYGQNLGQALLNNPGTVVSVPEPADFQPAGWNHYNNNNGVIPQIQAMCEEAIANLQCIPLPTGPPRPAPEQVVVNNGSGDLICMAVVLNATPGPLPPRVFARTCFPVQVIGPGMGRLFRNPLEPLDPLIYSPGDYC